MPFITATAAGGLGVVYTAGVGDTTSTTPILGEWEVVDVPIFSVNNRDRLSCITIAASTLHIFSGDTTPNGSTSPTADNSIRYTVNPTAGTWTEIYSPNNSDWNSVAYSPTLGANGLYIGVPYNREYNGGQGLDIWMRSNDGGASWSPFSASVNKYNPWIKVKWIPGVDAPTSYGEANTGNGLFVALAGTAYGTRGGTEGNRVAYSKQGASSWTNVTTPNESDNIDWWDFTYGGGTYVAVARGRDGPESDDDKIIMSSTDLVNWTIRSTGVPTGSAYSQTLWGVAYGSGQFVAVGSKSGTYSPLILTSPDGIEWTQQTAQTTTGSFSSIYWDNIQYGGGLFVITNSDRGSGGFLGNRALWSTNGVTWHVQNFPAPARYWGCIGSGLTYGMCQDGIPAFYAVPLYRNSYNGTLPNDSVQACLLRARVGTGVNTALASSVLITDTGLTTWLCPQGVYEVSVVCIGSGGAGSYWNDTGAGADPAWRGYGGGGGGGGLGWKNKIKVTPGTYYDVQVGRSRGATENNPAGAGNGEYSYFISTDVVYGAGGTGAYYQRGGEGGGYGGDGGGTGGHGGWGYKNTNVYPVEIYAGGGGGAGGYTGAGGAAGSIGYTLSGAASAVPAGGGGGGGSAGNPVSGNLGVLQGGAGVGVYGENDTGAPGQYAVSSPVGGSYGTSPSASHAGTYGGGGQGSSSVQLFSGQGAVRILWGGIDRPVRKFPSTDVYDV